MARVEVVAEVTGRVWRIEAVADARVEAEDALLLVESMKMEIPVCAPRAGRLAQVLVAEGDAVESGQVVAVIEA